VQRGRHAIGELYVIDSGTRISGRYEIVNLIGEGGMGEVYEAKHVHIGRHVAIKCLNKEYSKDKEAMERFEQEARIAGTLGHANICELMDFGVTDDGQPYLVMELMEGENLAELLKREKPLEVERALEITAGVLTALEEAHGQGIVHRDLKPENIFMAQVKGHGEVVKLLDFGISKIMKQGESAMRLTKTGMMVGTPFYMSPEQVRARTDIDHRTDLYACGVILFEMLTGDLPFDGRSFNEIIVKIIEDKFPAMGEDDDIPKGVASLIRKSVEKKADKRFQTAKEFGEAVALLQPPRTSVGSSTAMAVEAYSPDPARGLRGRTAAIIVAIVVFITGVGVLMAVAFNGKGKKQPVTKEIRLAAAPQEEKPPAESQKVQIELTDLPEGATVELNGREVEGSILEAVKSTEPVVIDVSAPGYVPKKLEIVPGADMEFSVELEKEPEPETPKSKKTPKEKPKKKPEPDEKTKPKKKPTLDWGYPG
jgi:tRNA A-37 threonylcarbamoyl transferase component Bud32